MAKNPAFQFYPMDWQRDLDEHPLEIEGAWIRICCRLWWASKRGELTLRPERWATILRKDVDCTNRIIDYLLNEKIASGKREANGYITLISRRMVADDKAREYNRLRQQRFYHKEKPNADITPHLTPTSQRSSSSSSSSSSTSSSKNKKKVNKEKKLYLDAIFLAEDEYQKLIKKYGHDSTEKAIEILNNAIMSKGYKYKSHYHTIIGWPMKEAQGNGNGRSEINRGQQSSATEAGRAQSDEAAYPTDGEF